MTKEQKALLRVFDELEAEWADADGERRGELQVILEDMRRRPDVAEALGARVAEKQAAGAIAK